MTILHTSTIFEKKWIASQIATAVACPTGQLVYVMLYVRFERE